MRPAEHFISFRNEFNKFNNTRARISYDIKNTLKSHLWRKNVIILSLCTQRCYGRHNVSRKSVNHLGDACIQIFIWGGISFDIRSEIYFYSDA